MIVGFLDLRFPGKTFVLCVIDISLCAYGCDCGLISFAIIIVEAILYLTSGRNCYIRRIAGIH
jgi:hypothetical protein